MTRCAPVFWQVIANQEVAVVEAMKMQNVLRAESDGVVKVTLRLDCTGTRCEHMPYSVLKSERVALQAVLVKGGDTVSSDQVLIQLE